MIALHELVDAYPLVGIAITVAGTITSLIILKRLQIFLSKLMGVTETEDE